MNGFLYKLEAQAGDPTKETPPACPAHRGSLSGRGAERRHRHHARPEGAVAAEHLVQHRRAEHDGQREAEDDKQQQRHSEDQVAAEGHRHGGPPPATVAQPGQDDGRQDGRQADDEVVRHIEVRHGLLPAVLRWLAWVRGVGAALLHLHQKRRVEEGARHLVQHHGGLDPAQRRADGGQPQARRQDHDTLDTGGAKDQEVRSGSRRQHRRGASL